MTREELRRMVYSLWGTSLERATLDELRDGLPLLQAAASPPPTNGVLLLDAAPTDYESAMREFFAQTLVDDTEEGFVQVWLTALELWLAVMTREERRSAEGS
jgi:hypothetical protein